VRGARPQSAEALVDPVNDLERDEDPACVWRHHVNDQLAGPYRALFDRLDALILLAALVSRSCCAGASSKSKPCAPGVKA
jgi:pantothenate kinase-related protein Tda10